MRYLALILAALVGLSNTNAQAEETLTRLKYSVYASGFHILDARISLKNNGNDYTSNIRAETVGMLKSLANWDGNYTTAGTLNGTKPVPTWHEMQQGWKNDKKVTEIKWSAPGIVSKVQKKEGDRPFEVKDVDPKISKDALDMLSILYAFLKESDFENGCTNSYPGFDGKRRFKMVFTDKGKETLDKSRHSIWQGEARKCQIEVVPDGGAWRKKKRGWMAMQEQGRKKGKMPTLWLGKLDGLDHPMPVRVHVTTNYGSFLMHLTDYKRN